jgi:hypothetical protein
LENIAVNTNERTYLRQFEQRTLGPESFDHRGHLYMAWAHLCVYEFDDANTRVCEGVRELATKFGASDKFNWTLTEALMRIMSGRMRDCPECSFDEFLEMNPDLLDDANGLLLRHYSEEVLGSPEARKMWVEPDICSFE